MFRKPYINPKRWRAGATESAQSAFAGEWYRGEDGWARGQLSLARRTRAYNESHFSGTGES
jgi:hypothetical protein